MTIELVAMPYKLMQMEHLRLYRTDKIRQVISLTQALRLTTLNLQPETQIALTH